METVKLSGNREEGEVFNTERYLISAFRTISAIFSAPAMQQTEYFVG